MFYFPNLIMSNVNPFSWSYYFASAYQLGARRTVGVTSCKVYSIIVQYIKD